jgi:2-(1,2-epoxy-1,2-dihydrophenyl)acetyl-CoA isomerase
MESEEESTMEYQYILVSVENRIATVTLNRPEASNAFARESYYEIADAMKVLGERKDVGAIVITGAGKHFSAGGDIKRFKMLVDTKQYLKAEDITAVATMPISIRECPKPVIAMVNGVATGAGLSCALACDFRIVQPSSKMIMAFVNMGLCGDNASIYNLTRLVGPDKAELMMMTGDTYRGEDCERIGLATVLAEEGKLEETTYALATKLAGKSSTAHGGQKRLIKKYFYGELNDFAVDEGLEIAAASRQPDFTEAVNAFIEKRQPEYNK